MTWHERTEDLSVHRDVARLPCSPCLQPQELSSQLCLGKRETRAVPLTRQAAHQLREKSRALGCSSSALVCLC